MNGTIVQAWMVKAVPKLHVCAMHLPLSQSLAFSQSWMSSTLEHAKEATHAAFREASAPGEMQQTWLLGQPGSHAIVGVWQPPSPAQLPPSPPPTTR